MRTFLITLFTTMAVTSPWVFSKPPVQPQQHQFTRLVTNSPFTIKPTPAAVAAASPLEREWSLGSISPNGNGYSVTLINKKNRKDRVRFIPGFSADGFKLLEVKQDTRSSKQSKVLVSKGSQKAWIGYDDKVVAVKTSGAAKSSKKSVTKPSSSRGKPPIPGRSSSKSTPRVRHVPRK